jgi:adenylylsulfate reductase subunit B
LKECRSGAISYFLGADIGGDGAIMSVRDEGRALEWIFRRRDGTVLRISVRRDESNAY